MPDEGDRRIEPDPNDVVPVPPAMEPAEIEKRADVVEALRKRDESPRAPKNRDDSAMREPREQ